ncbi:MAG: PqqD family protein [Puniceicoccaceae bacterium]|nr:MAG: PqqD family protein [Puniceicoccaceae bacterium]
MPLFFKRKPARPPLPPPDQVPEDAWQAVPRHAPNVEMKEDKAGKLYLRFIIEPSMVSERWFSRKFRFRRARKFHLDPTGKTFWLLIDGRRTLGQIEREMSRRFGWDRPTCRGGILQYTAALMERKLLLLDLGHRLRPDPAQQRNAASNP